jgi:hypothetical protein
MNELPEAIAFETEQKKHRRTWNYVMGLLIVISLVGIIAAIAWA